MQNYGACSNQHPTNADAWATIDWMLSALDQRWITAGAAPAVCGLCALHQPTAKPCQWVTKQPTIREGKTCPQWDFNSLL